METKVQFLEVQKDYEIKEEEGLEVPQPARAQKKKSLTYPPCNKTGHWSEEENAKYFAFLKKFKVKFEQRGARREWKVFKTLSQFIKTRDPNQCRSHHHKMEKNFSSVIQILDFLRRKMPSLEQKHRKYEDILDNTELYPEERNYECSLKCDSMKSLEEKEKIEGSLKPGEKSSMSFKKTDGAQMKTLESYEALEEEDVFMEKQNFSCPKRMNGNLNFFDNFGMMDFRFDHTFINRVQENLPLEEVKNKENEWKECHDYFLKWVQKVQSLI